MQKNRLVLSGLGFALVLPLACTDDGSVDTSTTLLPTTSTSGDGDGDPSGTETGTATGDGDGDMTGDGDGDPATGDGDGDMTGDGDGDEPPPECGNGIVESGEACDDGNDIDDDECSNECQFPNCGDGIVQDGEECDVGNETMFCDGDCTFAMCGDGYHNMLSEECDDGNDINTDGCIGPCLINVCGDGTLYEGMEECDDGNDVDTDECTNACNNAICGDGIIQDEVEECEDLNDVDTDACTNACLDAVCGDGILQEGVEECDDGNFDDDDDCPGSCAPSFCGDGFKHANEECDDGNDIDDDFCTNNCISLLWFVPGVQTDIHEDMLGGWQECWSSLYNSNNPNLTNTILGQNCTGAKLLEACRPVGSDTYTVLAMGDRADVIFDVGNQSNGKHEANGVSWYYSSTYSMGFAAGGDSVARNSCDTANVNPEQRLCWHTSNDGINGGWRCGSTTGLNGNAQWERKIFHAQ